MYLISAGVYIVVSTLYVGELRVEPHTMAEIELAKGLTFVLLTAFGLYWGAHFLMQKIIAQSTEIERQRASILMLDQRASAGLLASAIGHDANNLLSSVKISVEMLLRNPEPAQQRKMLLSINSVVDELVSLNRRLVMRGEADQRGELKLRSPLLEAKRALQFLDESHPINLLGLRFSGDRDIMVNLNRHLFIQIVINVLSNAVRHAGPKSKVLLDVRESNEGVYVEVHDDGPGVSPDKQEKVFEPYCSNHPEGAGLGLASVKAIMNLHQGSVACTPSKLGGACFSLKFPKPDTIPDPSKNAIQTV